MSLPGSKSSRFQFPLMTTFLALILALTSFSAQADALSDTTIRNFITTLDKARALKSELETPNDTSNIDSIDFSKMISSSVEQIKGKKAYNRLEDVVQDSGFNSLDDWAATGDRIYAAWMAIEMGDENPALNQDMQKAMADMENSPGMSDQQKSQMQAMMKTAMGATKAAAQAPPADIEAVRPHVDALKATSGSEN